MPFGVASAPAIFQRTMETILQGIPHGYVHVYIDDILVADSTEKEHLVTLEKVMSRLGECGIKLKRTKCKFMLPSVEYLGYHISGEGISPTKEKRRAIVDAPVPEDISQLKWVGELLRKIFALSCRHTGTTVKAAHQTPTVELGSRSGSCIPEG